MCGLSLVTIISGAAVIMQAVLQVCRQIACGFLPSCRQAFACSMVCSAGTCTDGVLRLVCEAKTLLIDALLALFPGFRPVLITDTCRGQASAVGGETLREVQHKLVWD